MKRCVACGANPTGSPGRGQPAVMPPPSKVHSHGDRSATFVPLQPVRRFGPSHRVIRRTGKLAQKSPKYAIRVAMSSPFATLFLPALGLSRLLTRTSKRYDAECEMRPGRLPSGVANNAMSLERAPRVPTGGARLLVAKRRDWDVDQAALSPVGSAAPIFWPKKR